MKAFLRHFGEDGILRRDIGELVRERRQKKRDEHIRAQPREKTAIYNLNRANLLRNECSVGKLDDQEADRLLGVTITSHCLAEVEFFPRLRQVITLAWGQVGFPQLVTQILSYKLKLGAHLSQDQVDELIFLRNLAMSMDEEEIVDIVLEDLVSEGILDIDEQKRRARIKSVS